jgi:hypothetical protein
MRILPSAPALFYAITAGGAIAAAPPNDTFAGRSLVTLAGSTGTNVEATVEASEPALQLDRPAAGTLWWRFEPSVSGWYEISTAGSAIDTVLAVYTGTAINTLSRVASANDDALNILVKTSRVQFHAAAGISYAVQIGSYNDAERGAVVLGIQPISPPANRVTSLTYSPDAPFNITGGDQTISFTVGLEHNAGLDFATLSVVRPDGVLLTARSFSGSERIAGNAMAGTYLVTVTVPRYAPTGNYSFWINGFSGNVVDRPDLQGGGWVWTSLPSSVTSHFAVLNTGLQDTSPPALASAELSPAAINVTATGFLVSLTLQLTDDLSGFTTAAVSLEQMITPGQNAVLVAGNATLAERTSGTANNGQYLINFFVPQDAPTGAWQVHSTLTDRVGNVAKVTSPAALTVTKNAYDAWVIARNLTGPAAAPGADPDLDGQTNLEEFAFHTDPKRGHFHTISLSVQDRIYLFQGALPLQYAADDRLHLRFLRRRGANAGTVTTLPQFGTNLLDWSNAVNLTVIPLSANWEMVDAVDSVTISASRRRLGRVLVTAP